MKHIQRISVARAEAKQDDIMAAVFFQFYFFIMSIMLTAAFSDKR
jgi:hypothetical protein